MTDILNMPRCATSANKNTAVPTCYLDIKKPVMLILASPDFRITPANRADLQTFKSFLQAQCLLGNLLPVPNLVLSADNSGDVQKSTDAYGNVESVSEGGYDWSFLVKKGGACYNAVLRSFNGIGKYAFIVDSDMNLLGTKDGVNMRPVTGTFMQQKFKLANGTDKTQYISNFSAERPEELNDIDKFAFVAGTDVNGISIDYTSEITGNFDVMITQVAVVLGKATVQAKLMLGGINMGTAFSTALAAAAAWVVKVKATNAAVVPSGVVWNATSEAFEISFTGTGEHTIELASATALAALTPTAVGGAGDPGYDSNVLTVTMPVS